MLRQALSVAAILALSASLSLAQQETIPLKWDPIPEASGYMLYVSPAEMTCPEGSPTSASPALEIPVGPNAYQGYMLSGLQEATEYWVTVKAVNQAGRSINCSNILHGWPTPRIDTLVVSPPTFVPGQSVPTWNVAVTINGHNFREASQSYYTAYPGLEIINYSRITDRQLSLTLQYTAQTEPGEARIIIVNHDGANCDPRPEASFTGCVSVDAGSVVIVPVVLPGNVTGLDWWVH